MTPYDDSDTKAQAGTPGKAHGDTGPHSRAEAAVGAVAMGRRPHPRGLIRTPERVARVLENSV